MVGTAKRYEDWSRIVTVGLQKRAKVVADNLPLPATIFDQSVAWSSTYLELFSNHTRETTPAEQIVDKAIEGGRVMLCGRAGCGKSVILRMLAKRAAREGAVVVFIDLRRWNQKDAHALLSDSSEEYALADFLIRNYSELHASLLDLDVISPQH